MLLRLVGRGFVRPARRLFVPVMTILVPVRFFPLVPVFFVRLFLLLFNFMLLDGRPKQVGKVRLGFGHGFSLVLPSRRRLFSLVFPLFLLAPFLVLTVAFAVTTFFLLLLVVVSILI